MKTDELMIGDWVCLNDTECGYIKVAQMTKDKIGFAASDGSLTFMKSSNFHPVSITPEILVRNGFVKGRFEKYECSEISASLYELLIRTSEGYQPCGEWSLSFEVGPFLKYGIDIKVQYVHELQHALRLVKIDKKIEL